MEPLTLDPHDPRQNHLLAALPTPPSLSMAPMLHSERLWRLDKGADFVYGFPWRLPWRLASRIPPELNVAMFMRPAVSCLLLNRSGRSQP